MQVQSALRQVAAYASPRPTTAADSPASPGGAAFSGGLEGYIATMASPEGAVGGALGGYVGLKVGQKTASLTSAMAAGFGTGAVATTGAMVGATALGALLKGTPVGLPAVPMLALYGTVGGLAGLSGMMQGSAMGDVRDSGMAGLLLGSVAMAAGASPLIPLTSSLAGSAAGMTDNKALKTLAGAGLGAALGAAAGALAGPQVVLLNAALGAATGAAAGLIGPGLGHVRRNAQEDLDHLVRAKLSPLTNHLGPAGLTAMAATGGAISSIPLALIAKMVLGVPGAVVTVAGMSALAGWKLHQTIEKAAELKPYSGVTRQLLGQMMSPDELAKVNPQAIFGITTALSGKYSLEAYQGLSLQQFQSELKALQPG